MGVGCGVGIKSTRKKEGWKIRYLKMTHITGSDYLNPCSLEMWYKRGRVYAIDGVMDPYYASGDRTPWTYANDDNETTTWIHAAPSTAAYITFDFGGDRVVDRIRLVYRTGFPTRVAGTRLTATDEAGNVILQLDNTSGTTLEIAAIYPSPAALISTSVSNWT